MKKRNVSLLLICLIIIALGLRWLVLTEKDFWFDEAFSFFLAQNSLSDLIIATAADNHPPLFYFFLHLWQRLNQGIIFLRLPSFFLGLISLFLIYLVAKKVFNHKTALIAFWLLALSPLHVYFSTETRMYSLWVILVLAGLYFFLKILKAPKTIYYWLFTISFLLALYTHYYTLLALLSLNFYLYLKRKKYKNLLLPVTVSSGLILLGFLPWLKVYFAYPHPECYCLNPWLGIAVTFTSFILGGVGDVSLKTMLAGDISLVWRISFFILLITTGTTFLFSLMKQRNNQSVQLLAIFLLFPLILTSLISLFYPIFSPRAFIIFSPAFYLITAAGLAKIKNQRFSLIILGTITLLNLIASISPILVPQFEREPLKETADFIKKNFQGSDLVAHASIFTYYPFRFYHQDRLPEFLVLPTTLTVQTVQKTGRQVKPLPEIIQKKSRLWFVNIPHRAYPDDIRQAKNFLNQNLELLESRKFKTIEVFLYQ